PLEDESCSLPAPPDLVDESEIEDANPRFVSAITLIFPPAFTIASPSFDRGEAMVKVGGRTLLSSRSRACTLIMHPQILRKSLDFDADPLGLLRRVERCIFA